MDIASLWVIVISFALIMYASLDGFDIGLGIIMFLRLDEDERDNVLKTILPVWDGNETWIVLAGVGLFGGFPLAYSLLLPAFYMVLITMLICIVVRGVSLEFRFQNQRLKLFFDICFGISSLIIAFCQGLVLGGLFEGIAVTNNEFSGSTWDFLTPFSVMVGITVVIAYMLHGSNWLVLRTDGTLNQRMQKLAKVLIVFLVIAIPMLLIARHKVEIFLGVNGTYDFSETLSASLMVFLGIMLGALVTNYFAIGRSITVGFVASTFLITGAAAVVLLVLWPNIVPPSISVWEAASQENSQRILLYGSMALIPVILTYTFYSYYVFRKKVDNETLYSTNRTASQMKFISNERKKDFTNITPIIKVHTIIKGVVVIFGILLFFILVGPFGETAALTGLIISIIVFLTIWAYKGNPN